MPGECLSFWSLDRIVHGGLCSKSVNEGTRPSHRLSFCVPGGPLFIGAGFWKSDRGSSRADTSVTLCAPLNPRMIHPIDVSVGLLTSAHLFVFPSRLTYIIIRFSRPSQTDLLLRTIMSPTFARNLDLTIVSQVNPTRICCIEDASNGCDRRGTASERFHVIWLVG